VDQALLKKKYGFENPFKPDPLSKKALRFLNSGKRLLDVGCGEGADSVFFAKRDFEVTAIDIKQDHLRRFRNYCSDQELSNITIQRRSAVTYRYPRSAYDAIICLLVVCCMRRSEFDSMLPALKRTVRPGGTIVMSARNYLDPEFDEYRATEKMIEPGTFLFKEDCCRFIYFLEKDRLREAFDDFEVLYYYEGYAPCKYNEHPRHGDSYIICRRKGGRA